MRRIGFRVLGRNAWAILSWLSAGLCLVQMSACSTPQPVPAIKPAATQPVTPQTKPATTHPVPVRTMTATIQPTRQGEASQRVYWRAPDQQVIRYTDKYFVLLNATGHPQSVLRTRGVSGEDVYVTSDLIFAEQVPEHMLTVDLHVPVRRNLQHLRDMDFARMTARETEVVDGAQLLRYELPYGITPFNEVGFHTMIWADPRTKRAVRFRESDEHQVNKRGGSSRGPSAIPPTIVEYSDIKFDEPLDDSLFRWPTLAGKSVEQEVQIAPPPDLRLKTLKISFEFPDGKQLVITGADLQRLQIGSDRQLVLADRPGQNFSQFTRGCAGKRLRVTLNDLPAQELEIVGDISGLQVIYPP